MGWQLPRERVDGSGDVSPTSVPSPRSTIRTLYVGSEPRANQDERPQGGGVAAHSRLSCMPVGAVSPLWGLPEVCTQIWGQERSSHGHLPLSLLKSP